MPPLRILHVASNGQAMGGMETNLETLLRFHDRRRAEPHVAFLTSGVFSERIKAMRPEVPTLECKSGRFRYPWQLLRTILALRNYIHERSIDGVIAQGIHAFVPASLAGVAGRVPTLLWVHGVIGGHELQGRWVRWGARLPARAVIVNSNRLRAIMDAYYDGKRPVRMIYFGTDLERFEGNERKGRETRKKLGLAPDATVVLLPGRITPWKGQEVLVRAVPMILERCPAARFLIVGGANFAGDEAYARRLRDLAVELGIQKAIQFTGYWADLPSIYAAADVVVNTSVQPEGFGIVMIEGMASGKPVVASRIGAPEEIVSEGETGYLFTAGDSADLARVLIPLLQQQALREKLGVRGRAVATERFSARHMAEEVENTLFEIRDGSR